MIAVMNSVQSGIKLHQVGRLAEADAVYQGILERNPDDPEALHLSGLVALQTGNYPRAEELMRKAIHLAPENADYYSNLGELFRRTGRPMEALGSFRKALSLNPSKAALHFNLAVALKDGHRLEEAIAEFREAIRLEPHYAQAHHSLGLALHANNQPVEAIDAFRRALALHPNYPAAYNSLGNALLDAGAEHEEEAIASFGSAIALRPDFAEAYSNLGTALWRKGRREEAVDSFHKALEFNPNLPSAVLNLAGSLIGIGQFDEALPLAHRAIALAPDDSAAYRSLALVLAKLGRIPEAQAAYREALRLDPTSAELQFELAAISQNTSLDIVGAPAPAGGVDSSLPVVAEQTRTMPTSYVRKIFDAYAPFFDQHLVQGLQYHVPEFLLSDVLAVPGEAERNGREILDLGCGTGLCALQFRNRARRISGVDLAPKMIEAARARGIYDELVTGEILPLLRERPGSFDLILAGDVFLYIGALEELFAATAAALRPKGLFAFSVECSTTQDVLLQPTRRFAHSLSYIRSMARRNQLEELSAREVLLRKDGVADIFGWIVVVRK